jgi:hypothetical protein
MPQRHRHPPHHASRFLAMHPHPRHPYHLPDVGAFPGQDTFPSPAPAAPQAERTIKRSLLTARPRYPTTKCNELITSMALLDNSAWVLLTFGENETDLLLGLIENKLTSIEKSLQTSGSAHII